MLDDFDINMFNDMEFDVDSDWICDEQHAHPFIMYIEQDGDVCPFRTYLYEGDDDAEGD